ncbi:MAG: RelA/SpoT family protein [Campylobacterales bacterium]|nr:RelA/SpoT family protein [Campylobacterales bacterium]
MTKFTSKIRGIRNIEDASELLLLLTNDNQKVQFAIEYATKAHHGQYRKSGEEYIIHPILVGCIVAYLGGDEEMVVAAVLHDVVEDTPRTIEDIEENFGESIKDIVDGLTKIDQIREENLLPSSNIDEKLMRSAMTFRKMLVKSIDDIRILVVKLCDRTHNILTLDALKPEKQKRIAEETLVVYAPIAHRLGISKLKNILEDGSFRYIFPKEFQHIESFLQENEQRIDLKLNDFISKVESKLHDNELTENFFSLESRIKHRYSIYLKLQRKGVSIDEVLDLLAVRIIVENEMDCYKVLGIIHTGFKPLVARFKDYIAIPKENGYQTIHTTVFHEGSLFEVQIRTKKMHHTAELGVAAHWKYKSGGIAPKTNWIKGIGDSKVQDHEFFETAKEELYSDEIVVHTPKGDTYPLPSGATALDMAFAIHTEIGERARGCLINKKRQPLLTKLKNGDLVKILLDDKPILRCTWISSLKTTRAKNYIKHACNQRVKEIDTLVGYSILSTFLKKSQKEVQSFLEKNFLLDLVSKIPYNNSVLDELLSKYKKSASLLTKFKPERKRDLEFDNIIITANIAVNEIHFDHCCHPKYLDDIVAFISKKGKAIIHHKQCDNAKKDLEDGVKAVKVRWAGVNNTILRLSISLDNKKGSLAEVVSFLANEGVNINMLHVGTEDLDSPTTTIIVAEFPNKTVEKTKKKLKEKFKIIEILENKDAYKE